MHKEFHGNFQAHLRFNIFKIFYARYFKALTNRQALGYNSNVKLPGGKNVEQYLFIALIIISIALIASIILQSKGVGLGGLTGADTGGVFTARRGIEKTLFYVTIGLGILFVILTLVTVVVSN